MIDWSPITLGREVKSVEVEGFVLTETKHPPALVIPRHAHQRASVSFVLKGSYVETLGHRERECVPSSLLIKPAGEMHADRYGQVGAQSLIIEVKQERLAMVRSCSKILDRVKIVRDVWTSSLALRIYKEFRTADTASALAIEGLILELLAEETRRNLSQTGRKPQPAWLLRAVELIGEDFTRDRLTLSKIATEVGVHPAHLSRVFRRAYNQTVGEYIRRLRLERAARELATSDRTLADIALRAGFYDQSHLTHAFRLHMKWTPAAFRAAHQSRKAHTKQLASSKT